MTTYEGRLKKAEYEVRPVQMGVAQEMVIAHHYAKGASKQFVYLHGLFHKSDPWLCLGIAWWMPPTKGAALRLTPDWDKVLTLSRLVILPGQPKNAASYLISQSVKLIQADGRWLKLVTYADTRQGHTGGIYRATNWTFDGMTDATPTWINPEGRTVAKKCGDRTRTVAEMEALGYRMIGRFTKLRFVMDLKPRPTASPKKPQPGQPSLGLDETA